MDADQKNQIARMRREGASYSRIAVETGLSKNTVKTFCRRNGLAGGTTPAAVTPAVKTCRQCGKPVEQAPGRKEKKFCSDRCRGKWWGSHLGEASRKSMLEHTCPACGRKFAAYGSRSRKYCKTTARQK